MVYTIYIDVLFILDFIIDYLILYAVAKITGARILRFKFALSAMLGAVVSVLSLFADFFASLPMMLISAYLMVGISFGFRRWKHLLVFLGVGAAFGGMVFAINYITENTLVISLETLIIASVASYVILFFAFRKSATGTTRKEYVPVEVRHGGKKAAFYALADSGNSLTDAITNTAVLIAELEALRGLFEREEYEMLRESSVEEIILKGGGKYRPIPFKTVGGGGLLPAFCPERVLCNGKDRSILIGISKDKIGENHSGIIGIEEE